MGIKRTNTPNTPNREELYQMAVSASRNGQNKGARMMFKQLLDQNKRDIRAMMWLSKLAPTDKEREAWLQRVIDLKPGYLPAIETLEKITHGKTAKRNQQLLRVGSAVYVVALTAISMLTMIGAATAPL